MRLFDTYSKSLVELPPPPGPIRMYVCGPTVYARAHVGNARPFVFGMWLRSWLRDRGYDVAFVHNITDVNDKIYDAAPGASAELAARATAWYLEDTGDLGLGMPDHLPKVTEHIDGIVRFIEALVDRGFAYAVDGDVYFRVARFPEYGRLSGQRPDQVEEQEPNPLKEDPRDFALWKGNKPGEDTSWASPWGVGRPGWHIECSAMAEDLLGPAFEIHGGGLDLVFPHHENELAQSRALGHPFAQIWAHNGLLRFTGEKMSKSAGNISTLRETLDEWGRETLLVFFLSGHWRKPIDFSRETMAQAKAQLESFRNALIWDFGVRHEAPGWEEFVAALDDDFNTPEALGVMHGWRAAGQTDLLKRALPLFGLDLESVIPVPDRVRVMAEERKAAREAGDFATADRLRLELAAVQWEVRDTQEPPGYRLIPIP
jgi:cysteinyl-tRNA synthetase